MRSTGQFATPKNALAAVTRDFRGKLLGAWSNLLWSVFAGGILSRFGKFGQRDKWKSCSLIAIKMAETRSNDDSTSTPKSHSDLQGEGGHGRPEGGKDPGRVG
jgi:hypothetical protein